MTEVVCWDESATSPWNKTVDTSFLRRMEGDTCPAEIRDTRDRLQLCIRVKGHSGRHMAVERRCSYPTAVWL
jgi:hypothetical protein